MARTSCKIRRDKAAATKEIQIGAKRSPESFGHTQLVDRHDSRARNDVSFVFFFWGGGPLRF